MSIGLAAPGLAASGAGKAPFTIVSLAAVTWGFGLVGRTRMLTEAWLRMGQPTLFVQVPSLRTALERVRSWTAPRSDAPVVRPWPAYPASWWSRLGRPRVERAMRARARALRRELSRRFSWDEAVALVIAPLWTPWLDELPFRHVVYDCIDELAVHVGRPELASWYEAWEEQLLRRASGATVTATRLGEALRARRRDLPIGLVRNGVDVDWFQRAANDSPRPADVPRSGRPVVGFVGAIYEWVDTALIRETAQRLPEFEFVFVGPHHGRSAIATLAALPNVRLLGARPYAQVPAYVQAFDVCWVPFRQNAVAQAANPVKVYEYLALGKPVACTPVADTDSFEGCVAVARGVEEMTARLRDAAAAPGANVASRVNFARRNSWASRARDCARFLAALDARG